MQKTWTKSKILSEAKKLIESSLYRLFLWKRLDAKREALVPSFKKVLGAYFKKQKVAALQLYRDTKTFLPDRYAWNREYVATMREEYFSVLLAGQKQGIRQISRSLKKAFDDVWDVSNPFVQNFIAEDLSGYANDINESTISQVQSIISRGISDGSDMGAISRNIRDLYDDSIDGTRATLIARTEVIRAYSEAQNQTFRESGVVSGREWVATQDDRTRDTHAELDGTIVGLDEMFIFGSGTATDGPGLSGDPAEDCNCRCAISPVTVPVGE